MRRVVGIVATVAVAHICGAYACAITWTFEVYLTDDRPTLTLLISYANYIARAPINVFYILAVRAQFTLDGNETPLRFACLLLSYLLPFALVCYAATRISRRLRQESRGFEVVTTPHTLPEPNGSP